MYIGGGGSDSNIQMQTVMVYDPQLDSFDTLPPYAYKWFSMAVVNNQLVGRMYKLTRGPTSWEYGTNNLKHGLTPYHQ